LQLAFLLLQVFHSILIFLILLTRLLTHPVPGFSCLFQVGFRFLNLTRDSPLFFFQYFLLLFVKFLFLNAI
jgi:hypothetical protein